MEEKHKHTDEHKLLKEIAQQINFLRIDCNGEHQLVKASIRKLSQKKPKSGNFLSYLIMWAIIVLILLTILAKVIFS